MVFRISSSSKRSVRESWRATRICAGVIGGSSGSSGSGSATGEGAVGGASGLGFDLFLEPGGLPQRLGAGGAGSGSGGVQARRALQEPPQELAQSLPHHPQAARQQLSFVWIVSSIALFQAFIVPGSSDQPCQPSRYMQNADAGASQVDDVALVVRQLEVEVPQGDGASQVDHVVLVGVGFHDIPHAPLVGQIWLLPSRKLGPSWGLLGEAAAG